MAEKQRQINIRLPADRFELLEAAAFVASTSASTLLTEAALDAIDRYEKEPATQSALRARHQKESEDRDKITPIRPSGSS